MYPRHVSRASLSLRRFLELNLRFITAGLLVGLVLCATAGLARAQNASSSNSAAARQTQDFLALNARYHGAGSVEQSRLLNNLVTAAAGRQQFLASLIADNPGEVLQAAVPAAVRANLPPAVRDYVEQEVETEGELEVMYEDGASGSRLLFFLKNAGERLALHFEANPPKHLLTGAKVRVKGVRVEGAVALASGDASLETLALDSSSTSRTTTTLTSTSATPAVLANTFGAQKTLVILVNFQDKPTEQPWTLDQARSLVFGTVSNFFLENSYQQTWLTGDVVGWYTIPLDSMVCDVWNLASYAKSAAAAAGINLSAYKHYVYAFPQNACGGLGVGSIGGNPSEAWIIGSLDVQTVSHEMGHNLGLYHSHGLDCGTSVLGSSCAVFEYGNTVDTMGNIAAGHYNAFQKERLGWLDYGTSPPITTVQTNGLYTIEPFEADSAGPKALTILKSTDATTGQQTWYYVEYRQAAGFDSFLATNSNILSGVLVHTGSLSSGDSSYLLDMTPSSASQNWSDWSDPALKIGQNFYDPDSGVTVAPVSVSSTGAIVSVSFESPVCAHANPTVALSPSSQSAQAGAPVIYSVSIANNDNTGCSASSFNLQATVPAAWTAGFAAPTLTLSPGTSASTTLTVTSPVTAIAGSYTAGVNAANGANTVYATTATATYNVSALATTVSTDKLTYAAGATVTITGTLTSGGNPVANAGTTFTVTKPNGATVTQTATTNTSGQAVYKLRLSKQKDPAGTYQARATATSNGGSASATKSFTVQ